MTDISPWVWFCIAWIGILIVVDVWCMLTGRQTLSGTITEASITNPIIPFSLGITVAALACHFWV